VKKNWQTPVLIATAAVAVVTAAAVVALVVIPHLKAARHDPGAALAAKAQGYYRLENYSDAAAAYDELLRQYPTSPAAEDAAARKKLCEAKALFVQARTLGRSGRYAEAGDVLAAAVPLAPDDVEVNYGVGWVYIQLAMDNAARAQLMGGAAAGDYLIRTRALAELGRARFERCKKLDAKHWGGYRGMALYYIFIQEYAKGLTELAEADKYSVRPEEKVAVARLRFQAYAGAGKMEDAKKVVDDLLKKYPDRGDVYLSLAEYYLRLPQPDVTEAAKALEVGLTKDFDDAGSKTQLYLTLSRLRLTAGDADGALAAVDAALEMDPFNGVLTDQYAVCYEIKARMPVK